MLLVFQAVLGILMTSRPEKMAESVDSPPDDLPSKLKQGGWVFLVGGVFQALVLVMLTGRFLFGGCVRKYTRYDSASERGAAAQNLTR